MFNGINVSFGVGGFPFGFGLGVSWHCVAFSLSIPLFLHSLLSPSRLGDPMDSIIKILILVPTVTGWIVLEGGREDKMMNRGKLWQDCYWHLPFSSSLWSYLLSLFVLSPSLLLLALSSLCLYPNSLYNCTVFLCAYSTIFQHSIRVNMSVPTEEDSGN